MLLKTILRVMSHRHVPVTKDFTTTLSDILYIGTYLIYILLMKQTVNY